MKKIYIITLFLFQAFAVYPLDVSKILIDRGFTDDNTCYIVCKGFPDPSVKGDLQVMGTAREAALLNAQIIAREMFDNSVDVVRNGLAEKYDQFGDYVIIHYIITQPGLISKLKISLDEMMK